MNRRGTRNTSWPFSLSMSSRLFTVSSGVSSGQPVIIVAMGFQPLSFRIPVPWTFTSWYCSIGNGQIFPRMYFFMIRIEPLSIPNRAVTKGSV